MVRARAAAYPERVLTVRCTAKLLDRLEVAPAPAPPPSTTRLGDWYATFLPLRPVHLVLLVNANTRLAAVLPARKLAKLAERIPEAIADVLRTLGAPARVITAERAAMGEIVFAKTADRSVNGTMNEFVFHTELVRPGGSRAELLSLAMELSRTPVSPLGHERPDDAARRVLGIPAGVMPRFSEHEGRIAAAIAALSADAPARPAARPHAPAALAAPATRVLELRVTLRGVHPAIWRRVQVFGAVSLQGLHRILQAAMGWENRHLHEFVAGEVAYGKLDPEFPAWRDQRSARLAKVLREPGDRLLYRYDFGDGWEHDVALERVLEAEPDARYPRVIAGARACPPEDCGGEPGYDHLLEVLGNPGHPEHRELLRWVGGAFDPEVFDARATNRALQGGRVGIGG